MISFGGDDVRRIGLEESGSRPAGRRSTTPRSPTRRHSWRRGTSCAARSRCSGVVASRSRQAAAPADPPASRPAPEEGPPEGVGPLRISSITGPQAADLRICLLPGDPSTVLFVSPTGRNGHHRGHHREAGRSRGRLHQHEAVSTASGTAPSAGWDSPAQPPSSSTEWIWKRAAQRVSWNGCPERSASRQSERCASGS